MTNAIAKLIGDEIPGFRKWSATVVTGSDNCIYGIPFYDRRVVKFNSVDKSFTDIGTDLGDDGEGKRTTREVIGCGIRVPLQLTVVIQCPPSENDTVCCVEEDLGDDDDDDNEYLEGETAKMNMLLC